MYNFQEPFLITKF